MYQIMTLLYFCVVQSADERSVANPRTVLVDMNQTVALECTFNTNRPAAIEIHENVYDPSSGNKTDTTIENGGAETGRVFSTHLITLNFEGRTRREFFCLLIFYDGEPRRIFNTTIFVLNNSSDDIVSLKSVTNNSELDLITTDLDRREGSEGEKMKDGEAVNLAVIVAPVMLAVIVHAAIGVCMLYRHVRSRKGRRREGRKCDRVEDGLAENGGQRGERDSNIDRSAQLPNFEPFRPVSLTAPIKVFVPMQQLEEHYDTDYTYIPIECSESNNRSHAYVYCTKPYNYDQLLVSNGREASERNAKADEPEQAKELSYPTEHVHEFVLAEDEITTNISRPVEVTRNQLKKRHNGRLTSGDLGSSEQTHHDHDPFAIIDFRAPQSHTMQGEPYNVDEFSAVHVLRPLLSLRKTSQTYSVDQFNSSFHERGSYYAVQDSSSNLQPPAKSTLVCPTLGYTPDTEDGCSTPEEDWTYDRDNSIPPLWRHDYDLPASTNLFLFSGSPNELDVNVCPSNIYSEDCPSKFNQPDQHYCGTH